MDNEWVRNEWKNLDDDRLDLKENHGVAVSAGTLNSVQSGHPLTTQIPILKNQTCYYCLLDRKD